MARRSDHTREELHEMALAAARRIVAAEGLRGLSTRKIAGEIGYAAGTLYQLFDDLDDLIMRLNGITLDALLLKCKSVDLEREPERVLQDLAECYIDFVTENPKLWTAVVEHNLPSGQDIPQWYMEKIGKLLGLAEAALAPLYSSSQSEKRFLDARVLWSGLYGIASLARAHQISPKLTPQDLVEALIRNYLAGLRAQGQTPRRRQSESRTTRGGRSKNKAAVRTRR